ncbi:MAG: hypothetical protein KC777_16340 [Cyanobacteria bacterium HKST-UBA02]|nr:hypothetical protein [Cyanobacteria bacterium HKST-UBA02]
MTEKLPEIPTQMTGEQDLGPMMKYMDELVRDCWGKGAPSMIDKETSDKLTERYLPHCPFPDDPLPGEPQPKNKDDDQFVEVEDFNEWLKRQPEDTPPSPELIETLKKYEKDLEYLQGWKPKPDCKAGSC